MQRVLEIGLELAHPPKIPSSLVGLEGGEAGDRGERVAGVGVAVEQLDDVLRPLHEGLVDAVAATTAPIGTCAEVRPLAIVIRSGTMPSRSAAEA